jgi:hypothetical protein
LNLKLCVFSNDPIISYFNKGEIKPRYFNPGNIFDEIHIITFIDNDIDSSKVKILAGNATLKEKKKKSLIWLRKLILM